jgi:hypothetical protein
MPTSRYLVALAVLLGHGTASAQIVVPTDWKRIGGTPHPESELVSCARQGSGALFRVTFDGPRLTATVMKEPDRARDPAPYDLDWAAALDEQPSPPGGRGQASAWATTYAREQAVRIVVPRTETAGSAYEKRPEKPFVPETALNLGPHFFRLWLRPSRVRIPSLTPTSRFQVSGFRVPEGCRTLVACSSLRL